MASSYNQQPDPIDPTDPPTKINNTTVASKGAKFVWENTQVAISYALSGIGGLIRAQYVGAHPSATIPTTGVFSGLPTAFSNSKFELAFALTAIEGLTIDVGGGFFLPFEDVSGAPDSIFDNAVNARYGGKFSPGATAGLGVKYATGPITVTFIVDGTFLQSWEDSTETGGVKTDEKYDLGLRLRPYLSFQYKINDTFTADVEGGIDFVGDSKYESTTSVGGTSSSYTLTRKGGVNYGFGAGLQTTLAPSCTIRVGLTYAGGEAPGSTLTSTSVSGANTDVTYDATKLTAAFSVPVVFSVSF
jgi:hypothetical protein